MSNSKDIANYKHIVVTYDITDCKHVIMISEINGTHPNLLGTAMGHRSAEVLRLIDDIIKNSQKKENKSL